ncbi:hypothetical protein [Agrobacterium tumefaciens]|uniref:hypothetical protein n=1 Tax=Agrobacterium tumefaciens TaxID=358 RepID=UPI001F31E423|nr:hypothetical protein [Agrobacterium tumefaciens]
MKSAASALSSSAVVIVLKILSEWCLPAAEPQKPRVEKSVSVILTACAPKSRRQSSLRQTLRKTQRPGIGHQKIVFVATNSTGLSRQDGYRERRDAPKLCPEKKCASGQPLLMVSIKHSRKPRRRISIDPHIKAAPGMRIALLHAMMSISRPQRDPHQSR